MVYNKYPKGCEWRKWDLHIHTPASFHWKSGNKFNQMNAAEVETTIKDIIDKIRTSDCHAFSIMDYWTFDGYMLIRDYIEKNQIKLDKLILPGMELRIEAPVDYRLNIHVILSDETSKQILTDFKAKLKIRGIGRALSDESIVEFAKTLDKSKAKLHGFDPPETLNTDDLLLLGSKTVLITQDSLEDALEYLSKDTGYVMLPYDTSDGLKNLDWKTQPAADNYFMKFADLIESRDNETIDLFLGIKTDKNRTFIDNFIKTYGGKPKPVVCGSDAHRIADYGAFPSNKICWVKSDPTFGGFKQIMFEPDLRVKIQEHKPDYKYDYNVIDKVRYVAETTSTLFPKDWIELNQNLNCIIGGKSSGKSVLLYHIAKTIDPDQVEKRNVLPKLKGYKYENEVRDFDFEVKWKDGTIYSLKQDKAQKSRPITYIPQLYIISLVEESKELNSLIIEFLSEQNTFPELKNTFDANVQSSKDILNKSIVELITSIENYENDLKIHKSLTSDKDIKEQKKKVSDEIKNLVLKTDVTTEEIAEYEKQLMKRNDLQETLNQKQRYLKSLQALRFFATNSKQSLQLEIDNKYKELSLTLDESYKANLEKITNSYKSKLDEVFIELENLHFSQIIDIEKEVGKDDTKGSLNEDIEKIDKEMSPFSDKLTEQKNIPKLRNQISELNLKEKEYKDSEIKINYSKEKLNENKETVFKNYTKLYVIYIEFVKDLNERYKDISDDLKLITTLDFDIKKFDEEFAETFDRRSTRFQQIFPSFDNRDFLIFQNQSHLDNVKTILDKVMIDSTLSYKAYKDKIDAIKNLLLNYFQLKFDIIYKNDHLMHMSPGKRGLILLELYLSLSNSTHPILIDQPEDNLDNRTIYKNLINFIKQKKTERQIIMVTHNANLVVSTDAEETIVANQSGQESDGENKEFQFEYISGSLEHSFEKDDTQIGVLYQMGIKEHICDILEGGREAFEKREQKYGF